MKTESDKGGGVAGHPFGKKKIGCFDKIPLKKGSGSPLFQSVFSPPPLFLFGNSRSATGRIYLKSVCSAK